MSELKLCSYCKSVPQANTWTLHGITETRYFCPNPDCPHSVRTVRLEQWNTRPIEDDLRKRIAELEAENAELKERVAMLDVTAVYKSLGEMGYIEQVANLKAENAAFQSRIAELEAAQRWIPVSERLPEVNGYYMAVVVDGFDDSRSVETLRYFGDGDWFTWSDWYVVTHWKEKPELPKVQE